MRTIKFARTDFMPKNTPCIFSRNAGDGRYETYVYKDTITHHYIVLAFSGRRNTPDINTIYLKEADAISRLERYIEAITSYDKAKAQYRLMKKIPTSLQVGDILVSAWGYDQTNVEFYQVTRVTGYRGVYVRPIHHHAIEGTEGYLCGQVLPVKDSFIANQPETYHIASSKSIAIGKHYSAHLWDGKPEYESSYA